MRNPKIFHHNDVLEITTRCTCGLPFTAAPFILTILEGILARAQELYPVTISHYTFMANHFHMVLVVKDPQDVSGFLYYFKCRTAHCINKLLGRRGSLWDARYDSPVILDADKLTERLVYHYTNPQRAHLVDSIEQYPHLTTWNLLDEPYTAHSKECEVVTAERLSPILAHRTLKPRQIRFYQQQVEDAVWCTAQLLVEPSAAYEALGCGEEDIKAHLTALKQRVSQEEEELSYERKRKGKKVRGAYRLIHDRMDTNYRPQKRGRKMICLGSTRKARAAYIATFKSCVEYCRQVYKKWKKGDFIDYPIYAFAPSKPVTTVPIVQFASSG